MKKKEGRTEVLYANVKKSNKLFIKKNYKRFGYSTASEMVDEILDEVRLKHKKEK